MAGQISHVIAGEEALRLARGTLDGLAESAGYFRLGCQGPDIFYHNQRTMPSGLRYGSLAHRRGYGSLVAAFASALAPDERRAEDPAGAYLLGLATHAALDRATHPFIVYFAGWAAAGAGAAAAAGPSRRGCHPFLERILDMALLRQARGVRVSDYDIAALLSIGASETADARIAALWAAALRSAYPRQAAADPLVERRAENALVDSRYFYALTNPAADRPDRGVEPWSAYLDRSEGLRLVALLYPRDEPEGLDAANEARAPWEHPSGEGPSSSASYFDLVEQGSAEAARAISAILESWRSGDASSLAAAIGDSGLSILDAEGRPAAPRLSRPLPLPQAMEAEFLRRAAGR